MKEERVVYEVGDLVRIQDKYAKDYSHTQEYGIVVGRTIPWHEAYELADTVYDDDSGPRYWNDVNYAPYHVMVLGEKRKLEWVSHDYMELIS